MEVAYKPSFLRQFKKLPKDLQDEASEKLDAFKRVERHAHLRVHALRGAMAGRFSFSVNYRYRIVFMWETRGKSAILLAIGDHAVYD
jgi:plasmid maintenance system killer protein